LAGCLDFGAATHEIGRRKKKQTAISTRIVALSLRNENLFSVAQNHSSVIFGFWRGFV
jgi:hypothetical protein